jgi:hypothetical protein
VFLGNRLFEGTVFGRFCVFMSRAYLAYCFEVSFSLPRGFPNKDTSPSLQKVG